MPLIQYFLILGDTPKFSDFTHSLLERLLKNMINRRDRWFWIAICSLLAVAACSGPETGSLFESAATRTLDVTTYQFADMTDPPLPTPEATKASVPDSASTADSSVEEAQFEDPEPAEQTGGVESDKRRGERRQHTDERGDKGHGRRS
jgi:hypothetical protein